VNCAVGPMYLTGPNVSVSVVPISVGFSKAAPTVVVSMVDEPSWIKERHATRQHILVNSIKLNGKYVRDWQVTTEGGRAVYPIPLFVEWIDKKCHRELK
jgi:hypothetical protein